MPTTKQRGSPVIYVAGSARELPAEVQDWLGQAENRAVASPHIYDLLAQLARGKKFAAIIVNVQSVDWHEMDFFEHAARLNRHTPIYVAGTHQQRSKLEAACRRGASLFDAISLSEQAAQMQVGVADSPVELAAQALDDMWAARDRRADVLPTADRVASPPPLPPLDRRGVTGPAQYIERPGWTPANEASTASVDAPPPGLEMPGDGNGWHDTDQAEAAIDAAMAASTPAELAAPTVASPESTGDTVPGSDHSPSAATGGGTVPGSYHSPSAATGAGTVPGSYHSPVPASAGSTVPGSEKPESENQPAEDAPIQTAPELQFDSRPSFRLAPAEADDQPPVIFPWSSYPGRPRRTPPRPAADPTAPPSTDDSPPATVPAASASGAANEPGPIPPAASVDAAAQTPVPAVGPVPAPASMPAPTPASASGPTANPPLNVRLTPEEVAALMGRPPGASNPNSNPNAEAQG